MRPYIIAGLLVWRASAQVNVLTANGNNQRPNANLQEFQLSPATVSPDTFGKIGSYAVDGLVYAQPLYVTGVNLPGGETRNVVYIATSRNTVYAFDAAVPPGSPPALLWEVSLGPPVPRSALPGSFSDITGDVGVLGTGAIDLRQGVLFLVSDTLRNGSPVFVLHALDLASGAERLNGPADISAAGAEGTVRFDARQHLQRPGLLVLSDTVYIAFGSYADQSPWHGWLLAYDAADVSRQTASMLTTPAGNGGSIWQSGRGLAADERGNIYGVTGNGDYDGARNFSQSFLRFSAGDLGLTGAFTPTNWKELSDNDFDLSAGPAVTGTQTIVGGDKEGNLYVLDAAAWSVPNTPEPPAKYFLASSSIFNFAIWDQPGGALAFVQGSLDVLKCYRIVGSSVDPTPVSQTYMPQQYGRIGITVSADASNLDTGIVWETSSNSNDPTARAVLHAYQASDLTVELWNSEWSGDRDAMGSLARFANPTVAAGRVYVPTFSNRVEVYSLLNPETPAEPVIGTVANAASYEVDAVSPGAMVAIFGSGLGTPAGATTTLDENGRVSTSLADTRVLFDGIPVPVTFAAGAQINAIAPASLPGDVTEVRVEFRGQVSAAAPLAVSPALPGVFSADGSGTGAALSLNQDGSPNSPAHPALPGSVMTVYATGMGSPKPLLTDGSIVADILPLVELPVTALICSLPAEVQYAGGSPGMVQGAVQVNVRIPDQALGPLCPMQLSVGGRDSQPGITVSVGRSERASGPN